MNDDTLLLQISISQIPGIGAKLAKQLINTCGSVEAVFKEKVNALSKIDGISGTLARNIYNYRNFSLAEDEIRFIRKHHIDCRFYSDADYPFRLKFCSDAPLLLFGKGNINWNPKRALSIVGTRRVTAYGRKQCSSIIEDLSATQVSIISGMAYGVDITAHRAALQHQLPTLAVVAHGLDRLYPSVHMDTMIQMEEQGGMITEFLSGTNPDRENFPKRNRIIAGLSDATLVVESGAKGGSMITADIALSYSRDVFAVPGNNGAEMSAGCNYLIHTQKASLVRGGQDIAKLMNWQAKKKELSAQTAMFTDLEEDEKTILSFLHQNGASTIDEICFKNALQMNKASVTLLNLEFKGMIISLPGKVYTLLS
jgi:DNA processing protein